MGRSYGILAGICLYGAGRLHSSFPASKYPAIEIVWVAGIT
jgi:hypothetical protein